MAVIVTVKASGIALYQACKLLQIKVRRIERWKARIRRTGSIAYGKPGPKQVVHAIMPVEREALVEYVGREETVDYSFQMLALKGAEEGLFCMSASSVRSSPSGFTTYACVAALAGAPVMRMLAVRIATSQTD